MTPTEAGVRELCANTRENMHLHLDLRVCKLASADIRVLTMFLTTTTLLLTTTTYNSD
ncbi:hypothetical protein PBNK5_05590 [Pectobacterium brasiliense]